MKLVTLNNVDIVQLLETINKKHHVADVVNVFHCGRSGEYVAVLRVTDLQARILNKREVPTV